jgi:hypothetical protein
MEFIRSGEGCRELFLENLGRAARGNPSLKPRDSNSSQNAPTLRQHHMHQSS